MVTTPPTPLDMLAVEYSRGVLVLRGPLTIQGGEAFKQALFQQEHKDLIATIDMRGVTRLDTVGAMWLLQAKRQLEAGGNPVDWEGVSAPHMALLSKVEATLRTSGKEAFAKPRFEGIAVATGKLAFQVAHDMYEVFSLLGEVCVAFVEILLGKRIFRTNSFVRHVREAGLQAMPIVALISFLMSIVMAYQGVSQLELFGAQRFAINLVAISTLREMGGLLAAIMVAGRSGSSFTSEIGVMKIREEVDAMTVMGMTPLDVMILPRIAALIVALPLLTVVAFIAGILGGATVSVISLGVDFPTYLQLFGASVSGHTHWVGLVKAPVFALFIGLISCLAGLRVAGSAESVGVQTTRAVVQGIFSVLVIDAVFSIFFARIGW